MLSTSAAPAVRDTMSAQGFELPQIFEKKTDAIAFLEENKLWILQPGLWVMTKAEPKLQVTFCRICMICMNSPHHY